VHGVSEHHSLTDLRAAIRQVSVRAEHLDGTLFSTTCSAWIIPLDVTYQDVKIEADASASHLRNGQPPRCARDKGRRPAPPGNEVTRI
jgi:hypothetical protein